MGRFGIRTAPSPIGRPEPVCPKRCQPDGLHLLPCFRPLKAVAGNPSRSASEKAFPSEADRLSFGGFSAGTVSHKDSGPGVGLNLHPSGRFEEVFHRIPPIRLDDSTSHIGLCSKFIQIARCDAVFPTKHPPPWREGSEDPAPEAPAPL